MSYAWGHLKRAFRRVAPAFALVLVFVVASAAGFVLHLGTTPGRRFVTRLTNSLVSEILVSDLRIESIEVLSPTTLRVSRVELVHHSGKPVLVAEGLEVHFGLLSLLRGILGEKEVRIEIPDVRVDRFTFALTRDVEKGGFTIESAFDTVPSAPSTSPSKPVFVALPKMQVAAATVTTDQPGIDKTTARLTRLSAGLDLSPSGVVLSLRSDDTKVTGLLARDIQSKLRSELRLPGTTRAELDARVGQVPLNAEFGMRGAELDIGASSAELAPAALRDLLGSWPILVPLRVNARVKGEPSAMKATAQAELGTGRVSAAGSLVLVPDVSSKLDIHAEDLDLRAFDASAPQTAIDVDATLTLRLARGFEMETTATFRESTVAGYPVPALKVHATYTRDVLAGTATILDPKLASVVEFRVSGDGKVEFETKSADVDLAALARYGVAAKGRAALHTKGALEAGRLAATFDASFRNADVGAARVESVSVRGSVSGPLSRPNELEIEVEAQGTKLTAAGATLPRFRATVRGAGGRHAVSLVETSDKTPIFDVSADVALGKQVVVSDVRLDSRRGDDEIRIAVKRVEVDAGGVRVHDISLRTGQGSASGSITLHGQRRVVDLVLTALDVREAVSALGVSVPGVRGRLDGRVHFEEAGSERSGEVDVELRDGGFPPYADVGAKLAAKLHGSDIDVDAELTVQGVGELELEGRGSLRRSLFDPRAARELVGNATLAFSGLDLEAAS
ncbi:MAG TPA: hypothetical protein VMS65_11335, partial [Polyangiaceae bacterium]|nr:hypothetical protein [Polyangiaceae bacterium]